MVVSTRSLRDSSRRRSPAGLARVWGTFGWLVGEVGGSVAAAAVRLGVERLAIAPGRN